MRVSPFHYKHKYTGSQRGIELRKTHEIILAQLLRTGTPGERFITCVVLTQTTKDRRRRISISFAHLFTCARAAAFQLVMVHPRVNDQSLELLGVKVNPTPFHVGREIDGEAFLVFKARNCTNIFRMMEVMVFYQKVLTCCICELTY